MDERPKILGAGGGALGLSVVTLGVAACCVAPWAVTLFGVGGAVMLARLSFVQPYAVAATLVLIALGFWYVYRRAPRTEGNACAGAPQKPLRWFMWAAALLAIAIDAASFAPHFFGWG